MSAFVNYPADKKGVILTVRLFNADYQLVKEIFNDEPNPQFTIISAREANSGMTDVEMYFELLENLWFLAKRVSIRECYNKKRK